MLIFDRSRSARRRCESCGRQAGSHCPGPGWLTTKTCWLCPTCAEPQPDDPEILAEIPLTFADVPATSQATVH